MPKSKYFLQLEENKVSHCSHVAWLKASTPPHPCPSIPHPALSPIYKVLLWGPEFLFSRKITLQLLG